MDKKIFNGITENLVNAVKDKANLTETEARALVGIALRRSQDALVASIVAPTASLATPPATNG